MSSLWALFGPFKSIMNGSTTSLYHIPTLGEYDLLFVLNGHYFVLFLSNFLVLDILMNYTSKFQVSKQMGT